MVLDSKKKALVVGKRNEEEERTIAIVMATTPISQLSIVFPFLIPKCLLQAYT
jgi:hypothetical protein